MKKRLKIAILAILSLVLAAFLVGLASTPNAENVRHLALGSDRVLTTSDGEVLQTLRTDFKKRRLAWYPLSSFPMVLQNAVLQTEDRRFQSHIGFDPIALARALYANIRGQRVQGASTISMQLSDLIQDDILLRNQQIKKRSFGHKIMQLVRGVLLEVKWSKEEILEAYLNLIHLRGEFQGIPALSYAYLHKHPLALDGEEAAVIAVMISSPNQSKVSLKKKSCALLMKQGIRNCDGVEATVESFFSNSPAMPSGPELAPHLARRIFTENKEDSIVATNININLQQKVMTILEKNMHRLKDSNARDTAAIVIENRTGNVIAYVGSVSTSKSPHVDGVISYRQAGSSLKPFLYAKAFEAKTLTAASILIDDPTAISWNGDVYRPTNYDKRFYGPVSVREALGSSLNVPAVKTVTILGLHQSYQVLQSLQFTKLKEPDYYGVSLALGAVDVRLDELANAYRMLSNGGEWTPLHFQADTKTKNVESKRLYSPEAVYIVSSILSDPNARAIGFGWESPLETPFWTAVKTGTSKDYHDNWCAGFSELYTVAVWAGNFDAEAMYKVSGVSGVGPSWFEIMTLLHEQKKSSPPLQPAGVINKEIRHPWVSNLHKEFFIKGTEPTQSLIEPAPDKKVQFVFPAEGSVLVKDPHMDQNNIALFVRFKGSVPEKSILYWNQNPLGPAISPFKIEQLVNGPNELSIQSPEGTIISKVKFLIKGAE